MGKRKIGEINRKPIVMGDPNLVTKNEVNVDSLSSNGGGEEWKYIKYDLNDDNATVLLSVAMGSFLAKFDNGDGTKSIYPISFQATSLPPDAKLLALGISWNTKVVLNGMLMTIGQMISEFEDLSVLTFLTEEEFYNIETA